MHAKKPSVFFPIIDNGLGFVRAGYTMSMISALMSLKGHSVTVSRISDSHPSRSGNQITATFLESGCDEIFWIDTDIIFTPHDITHIMEHKVLFVCGIYPKRQVKLEPVLCTLPGHVPDPLAVLVPVKRAGRGFMRIQREVFERMKPHVPEYSNHGRPEWDFWPSPVIAGEYLSEDWAFCDKWRELGGTIYVDQRVQVQHEGSCVYPIDRDQL